MSEIAKDQRFPRDPDRTDVGVIGGTWTNTVSGVIWDYIGRYNIKAEKLMSVGYIWERHVGDNSSAGGSTQIDSLIDRSITEISNSRVTKVGDYAFQNCGRLTTVDFPAATSIGNNAFYSCNSLSTVNFPAAKGIGDYAFQNCGRLTTVDFPAATSIGSFAFTNCSNLTTVNFPAAKDIFSQAFSGCSSLTTVNFPAALTIKAVAFGSCSNLTTANFPAAKDIIGWAFSGCSSLTALILSSTNGVCTLSTTEAFSSTPIKSGNGYIYVPAALVDSYKAATNWSKYVDQIRAIENYPDITGGAA